MNKKQEIVPKLRFPEFEVDYNIKFLRGDSLFEPVVNKNHNSDLPLLAITQDQGAVPRDQIDYNVTVTKKSLATYKVVEIGDFIISLRSFQGGIEYSRFKGICSPAYVVLRKKRDDVLERYYKYYFKLENYIQKLNRNLEGIRDGKMISYSQFSTIKIPYPSLREQQKVADCLSSIDKLIDVEGRKLELLKKYKKGLMQKLFPAEGKTLPEWRFPEFQRCGEWISKPLGKISEILMCKRIFANETDITGEVPFYKIGTLGGKPDRFISRSTFERYKELYNFPKEGEVLISCSGTVGRCLQYDGCDAYFQDSNIVWVDNQTLEIDNDLLFHLLSGTNWNRLNSTTITRIYTSDLKELIISFPVNKNEQLKIANCLSSIDSLIEAQSNKFEFYRTQKKGLMQGLFPSFKEADE